MLVCVADHGHLAHGTSLFDARVSAQVAAAAARGESAVSLLARGRGHELLIADLGLVADTPPGVRDRKLARGTADLTAEPALTEPQLDEALRVGRELAAELADGGVDCLVLGEIGMGNTTTAAALTAALTGAPSDRLVGRGTGVDAAGLKRKRTTLELARIRYPACWAAVRRCSAPAAWSSRRWSAPSSSAAFRRRWPSTRTYPTSDGSWARSSTPV